MLLVVFSAIYMAIAPRPLIEGAISLVRPERRDRARQILTRLRGRWLGWMLGVLVDMIVNGVLVSSRCG